MTVEQQLRDAMRAHDVEAPIHLPWPAADVSVARRRRRTPRFALAVVLVAVLVAGGTWLAVAWPRTSHTETPAAPAAPLGCPAAWTSATKGTGYAVPAVATVPGAADRLVPDTTPDAVVVCGYVGGTGVLTGSSVLAGDLAPVTGVLTYLPRGVPGGCPDYAVSTDGDDYLVGLSYDNGTVWVSAPANHCAGAGNGAFSTPVNLLFDVSTWLAAGRYLAPPATTGGATGVPEPQASCPFGSGRLGQEAQMVPGTPTSLTICLVYGLVAKTVVVQPDRIQSASAALNALPATPAVATLGGASCGGDTLYALVFGYAAGPDVRVAVSPDCTPAVGNRSLQASDTADLERVLYQLTH